MDDDFENMRTSLDAALDKALENREWTLALRLLPRFTALILSQTVDGKQRLKVIEALSCHLSMNVALDSSECTGADVGTDLGGRIGRTSRHAKSLSKLATKRAAPKKPSPETGSAQSNLIRLGSRTSRWR